MTTNLVIVLLILLALCGITFAVVRWGRKVERGQAAESSNKVKDKQLQTAADAPRDKGELVDRIRKEGW